MLVGRSAERNERVVADIVEATGNHAVSQVAADMGDYGQVRGLAEQVLADHDHVDVLIHNAGALIDERRDAPDGTEATVASQVVGPFLLTSLLLERLAGSAPSRVLTMSSGGMYTAGLTVSGLQMSRADYKGAEQYARAKRAQVSLNEEWAARFGNAGVHFHALHPGWVDPRRRRIAAHVLQDHGTAAAHGRAGSEHAGVARRGRRSPPVERAVLARSSSPQHHKLRSTKRADTPERRDRLWAWVADTAGHEPSLPDATDST